MTGSSPARIGLVSHARVNSSLYSRIFAGNDLVDQPITGKGSPEACRDECRVERPDGNSRFSSRSLKTRGVLGVRVPRFHLPHGP